MKQIIRSKFRLIKLIFKGYLAGLKASKQVLELQKDLSIYKNNSYQIGYLKGKNKLFCILEQGSESNCELAKNKKKIFKTAFSDCYRLNWKNNKNDDQADLFKENVCWSEGRSLLFNEYKNKFDYFIFVDDDVDFCCKDNQNPAEIIREQLIKYKPIHGSIPSDAWKGYQKKYIEYVLPMKGGDQCVQFFRSDFANIMFPTWNHGSSKSMWYSQFIAHVLFPKRSIFFKDLYAKNTKHELHEDRSLESFNQPNDQIDLFAKSIKDKTLRNLFKNWKEYSYSPLTIKSNFDHDLSFKKEYLVNFLEIENKNG